MVKNKLRGTTGIKPTQIRWFSCSQAVEAGLCEQWSKDTQESLELKRDYKNKVHSGQMVLAVVRQGGWTM